jgi:hypothetical protein
MIFEEKPVPVFLSGNSRYFRSIAAFPASGGECHAHAIAPFFAMKETPLNCTVYS